MNRQIESISDRLNLAAHFEGVGVELGVAWGKYSDTILHNAQVTLLHSVDRWAGDRGHGPKQMAAAEALLARHGDRSVVVRQTFTQAAALFCADELDFVYVDGYAHTGQDNGRTLAEWWPKVKPGGIFAGHDYCYDRFPQTVNAVDQFCASRGLDFDITTEPLSSWFLIKG